MNGIRKSFGILIGGVNTFFPKDLMKGIEAEAEEQDANVLFFLGLQTAGFYQDLLHLQSTHSYDYQFNTIYDYSLYSGMDGLIINYGTIGVYLKHYDPKMYADKFGSVPVVFLTDYIDDPAYTCIISDNYRGMYDIVSLLFEKYGCRNIIHMAGPHNNLDASERKRGYLDACRDHGLEVTDDMVMEGDFSEFVTSGVVQLMEANPDADAIAFANDEMAFAGYKAAAKLGKRVGKDILFTGFDNCDFAVNMDPPLATLFQDGRKMGRMAVNTMVRKLSGEDTGSVRVPVSVVERESCGYRSERREKKTVRNIEHELEEAYKTISVMKQDNMNELRKSWFIPYFARELDESAGNDRDFCLKVVEGLKHCTEGNSFLFLTDTPVACYDETEWKLPADLRLAAWCKNDECFSYEYSDRPVVDRDHTMLEYMEDGRRHGYLMFLLFSGPIQYGLLACESKTADFSFFYMLSLQLGISFGYHEGRKIELALQNKLLNDMEEIRVEQQKLVTVSEYDPLTGLLNRRGLFRKAEAAFAEPEKDMYLIFADLDHLKQINDNFGHAEGDFAIKNMAGLLKNVLREGDLICRLGGDEFVCLVVGPNDKFPEAFEKRRAKAAARLNERSRKPYYIEFSYGIHKCHLDSAKALEEAIGQADTCLYEAKKGRRECVLRL